MHAHQIAVWSELAPRTPEGVLVSTVADGSVAGDDLDEVHAWERDNPQPYDRDAYQGAYADVHGTPDEPHVGLIKTLAASGLDEYGPHGPVAAMGVPGHLLPSWDSIQFVCDMSFGALSEEAKVALALGADAIALSNSAIQAIGCLGMRACHTDNCPVGIATQKKDLRARLVVDEAARRLEQFCPDDLTTLDREMAHLTGVSYGGMQL